MIKITTAFLAFALTMTIFSANAHAEGTTAAQKDWTFLVYINGHNNLDSYGAQNIKSMEQVGSSDKLNIVVQWASLENNDTRRLLIQKDTTGSQDVTFSAFDMSKYDSLLAAVKTLATELGGMNAGQLATVKTAASGAQAFYDANYKDLYDFVIGVEKSNVQAKATTLADVKTAVQNFVIESDNTSAYKNAHGLSIWLPESSDYTQYQQRYTGLAFDKATGWSQFLSKIQ